MVSLVERLGTKASQLQLPILGNEITNYESFENTAHSSYSFKDIQYYWYS